ncbi:hypothetical protein IQ251_14195 [Saccharopolyspora sp. HNM0983]|uniref:DUF4190 domain-containing protein n=1 Tax=Saccharopolyspora montiporae TaxID=2781240 RepID=A0A929BB98_9PSEU|nr:hypothetical protein [Saccharopolyspora sp. HNM0983]MBE9375600.1 hypothetical protein [Saccharopolyspora sp. HNM0983]
MNEHGGLPAKDRPGRSAWLGPASLALGMLSWALPGGGAALAAAALVCGVVSMRTRGAYRIDGTAVAGSGVAVGQLVMSLLVVGATQER